MERDKKTGNKISRRAFIGQATALSVFSIVPRSVLGGVGFLAPSDMINLGLIGTGKQSTSLLKSFHNTGQAQVIAACDVYGSKLQHFLEQNRKYHKEKKGKEQNSCTPYKDFRELLEQKDIDGIVIASPDHWHAVHAVKSAEAGKDIYCEKPLALTIEEGDAIVEAVQDNKRVFQTGSMQRSWPEFRHAVELIRNGYIGEIREVKVSIGGPPAPFDLEAQPVPPDLDWDWWLGPNTIPTPFHNDLAPSLKDPFWPKWRNYKEFGGGGMTDWGAHMFDIVQWALDMDDSGPEEIIPPDGNEFPFLTYKYENDVIMTHENFGLANAIRFIGTSGTIDIQRGKLESTPKNLAKQPIGANEKRVYFSENHYKDWLNAMRNRTKPICDASVGHRTASVCTLGNIAYELNRPLRWNPKREKFRKDREANDLLSRPMRNEWGIKL